jgi:UDP-N-acetylglucosamine--N-acetylmuramyl-(pentapeptide) pyrophosphoryl-undecaprenol N-acetylglucosamine transferase
MQKELNKRIIITGGGSGGHVSVAQSIISELEKRYSNTKEMILYIGGDLAMIGDTTNTSIEERIIVPTGYTFKKLRAGKLQRYFSLKTFELFFRGFLGISDAYNYVKEFKPDLIISTGGFVSVPVALAAFLLKIPLYIHEQTASVGLSNRIAGFIAKKIFVSFEQSLKFFPKKKTIVVGNPVRDEIFQSIVESENAKTILKMSENKKTFPIILVMGGSLGSHIINVAIRNSLTHILEKYQIILQTGVNQTFKDYDVLIKDRLTLPKEKQNRLLIVKSLNRDEIGTAFKYSDVYLGRSGANFVYELGLLQIKSILVPIPWVTHNEQEKNANILVDMGTGTIVREGELSKDKIMDTVKMMLDKEITLKTSPFIKDSGRKLLDNISELS